MSYFDIALLALIAGFGLFGLWFGLVHAIFSLVGTFVGLYFASRFYEAMGNWLMGITGWSGNFSKVLMFIIAFILIAKLVSIIFWLIEKILGLVINLPIISGLNHLLGGLFGLIEGVIIIGICLFFIVRFPVSQNFMNKIDASKIAPYTVKPVKILTPLIPDAVKFLQSTVKNII